MFQVVILVVLIVINGVLSMSELAIVSARTARLQQRADNGGRGANAALELVADPNRFLSTVQIGITAIGIVNGVFGGAALSGPLSSVLGHVPFVDRYSDPLGVIIVVIAITYLSLVIGELVPKQLALKQPETLACLVAPWMMRLSRITAPAVAALAMSSDFLLRLLHARGRTEPSVSVEEVAMLLKQGTEAGIFAESERSMVEGVFDIGNRTAIELMTPRHRIDFLDIDADDVINAAVMGDHPHNYFPVYEGSTDNVVGIVAARELWRRTVSGESTALREAMEPALFVPEIAPIPSVIDQMRHRRSTIVLVIDEYGGVEGLITLNDVFSDLVGELDDPHRTTVRGGVRRDDGSWLLDGVFPVHEVRELFRIDEIPGEDVGRFESVGGFVMDQLGTIPFPSDYVDFAGYRFEIIDMDGNRIDKVLVSRLGAASDQDGKP